MLWPSMHVVSILLVIARFKTAVSLPVSHQERRPFIPPSRFGIEDYHLERERQEQQQQQQQQQHHHHHQGLQHTHRDEHKSQEEDVERWADTLITDGPDSSSQSPSPKMGSSSQKIPNTRRSPPPASHHLPEDVASRLEWIDSFLNNDEYQDLSFDHDKIEASTSGTSATSTSKEHRLNDAASQADLKGKYVEDGNRKRYRSHWTKGFDPVTQRRIRSRINHLAINKYGKTSSKLRHYITKSLTRDQMIQLAIGQPLAIDQTLSVHVPDPYQGQVSHDFDYLRKTRWTSGFNKVEQQRIRAFGKLVAEKIRTGTSSTVRNNILQELSRSELIAIAENKQEEIKVILATLLSPTPPKIQKEPERIARMKAQNHTQ